MVKKHPCPECGANLEWSAKRQSLQCPYCGTLVPWSDETREQQEGAGGGVAEQDLQAALSNPESGRGWGKERR